MKAVREPIPWKERAVVFAPWKQGTCKCGREDWLRYWTQEWTFECLDCWLGHRNRANGSHGFENDARLRWLWEQVRGGGL